MFIDILGCLAAWLLVLFAVQDIASPFSVGAETLFFDLPHFILSQPQLASPLSQLRSHHPWSFSRRASGGHGADDAAPRRFPPAPAVRRGDGMAWHGGGSRAVTEVAAAANRAARTREPREGEGIVSGCRL